MSEMSRDPQASSQETHYADPFAALEPPEDGFREILSEGKKHGLIITATDPGLQLRRARLWQKPCDTLDGQQDSKSQINSTTIAQFNNPEWLNLIGALVPFHVQTIVPPIFVAQTEYDLRARYAASSTVKGDTTQYFFDFEGSNDVPHRLQGRWRCIAKAEVDGEERSWIALNGFDIGSQRLTKSILALSFPDDAKDPFRKRFPDPFLAYPQLSDDVVWMDYSLFRCAKYLCHLTSVKRSARLTKNAHAWLRGFQKEVLPYSDFPCSIATTRLHAVLNSGEKELEKKVKGALRALKGEEADFVRKLQSYIQGESSADPQDRLRALDDLFDFNLDAAIESARYLIEKGYGSQQLAELLWSREGSPQDLRSYAACTLLENRSEAEVARTEKVKSHLRTASNFRFWGKKRHSMKVGAAAVVGVGLGFVADHITPHALLTENTTSALSPHLDIYELDPIPLLLSGPEAEIQIKRFLAPAQPGAAKEPTEQSSPLPVLERHSRHESSERTVSRTRVGDGFSLQSYIGEVQQFKPPQIHSPQTTFEELLSGWQIAPPQMMCFYEPLWLPVDPQISRMNSSLSIMLSPGLRFLTSEESSGVSGFIISGISQGEEAQEIPRLATRVERLEGGNVRTGFLFKIGDPRLDLLVVNDVWSNSENPPKGQVLPIHNAVVELGEFEFNGRFEAVARAEAKPEFHGAYFCEVLFEMSDEQWKRVQLLLDERKLQFRIQSVVQLGEAQSFLVRTVSSEELDDRLEDAFAQVPLSRAHTAANFASEMTSSKEVEEVRARILTQLRKLEAYWESVPVNGDQATAELIDHLSTMIAFLESAEVGYWSTGVSNNQAINERLFELQQNHFYRKSSAEDQYERGPRPIHIQVGGTGTVIDQTRQAASRRIQRGRPELPATLEQLMQNNGIVADGRLPSMLSDVLRQIEYYPSRDTVVSGALFDREVFEDYRQIHGAAFREIADKTRASVSDPPSAAEENILLALQDLEHFFEHGYVVKGFEGRFVNPRY